MNKNQNSIYNYGQASKALEKALNFAKLANIDALPLANTVIESARTENGGNLLSHIQIAIDTCNGLKEIQETDESILKKVV